MIAEKTRWSIHRRKYSKLMFAMWVAREPRSERQKETERERERRRKKSGQSKKSSFSWVCVLCLKETATTETKCFEWFRCQCVVSDHERFRKITINQKIKWCARIQVHRCFSPSSFFFKFYLISLKCECVRLCDGEKVKHFGRHSFQGPKLHEQSLQSGRAIHFWSFRMI